MHLGIFPGEELFAFFKLLAYALGGLAVGGVEGLVVAVGAAGGAECAVAVGAGEACVDGYLLCLVACKAAEPFAVCVEFDHRRCFDIYRLQR